MKKILLLLFLLNLALWSYYFRPQTTPIGTLSVPSVPITQPRSAGPTPPTLTLLTTGDVMLGRTINQHSVKTNNFTWPFAQIADTLRSADITFINLENPMVKNCPLTGVGFTFCSDPKSVQGLAWSGVDVANLANNHTSNYGQSGLDHTISLLTSHNISVTGVTDPIYKTIQGTTFAPLDFATVTKAIASTTADIVVVAFHWGAEYTAKPTARQIALAHASIDAGADIIVGNHPHWPQTIEVYQGKYIYYSHGNLVFDQFWSAETQKGVIIKTLITNKQLSGYKILPIKIQSPGFATLQ